jgi:hypothetical protein
MKKLFIIAVFAIFSASSAMSASLGDLNFSIGVSGSHGAFAGEGTERNNDESGATKTTTTEYGAFTDSFGSIFVEAGNDIISVGLDYVPSAIGTPENVSREGTGSSAAGNANNPGNSKVQVDFEDLTTVYVKVNLPLGNTYLKAGFHEVDVVINESMSSGNTYADTTTEGYSAGLGYAHSLDNGISVRAELLAMSFEDVETNNGVAASGNRNTVQVESMWGARGTISLVKTF